MHKKFYKYQNSIVSLNGTELDDFFVKLEKKVRNGDRSFVPDEIFKEQVTGIKINWPEDLRAILKDKIKEESGDAKPTKAQIKKAMVVVLEDYARLRAKKRAEKEIKHCDGVAAERVSTAITQYELKVCSADIALSMFLKKAPNPDPSMVQQIEKLSVALQISDRPVKLVVDCDRAEQANIYIFGIYNEDTKKTYLFGWVGISDVKKAQSGNKTTDPDNCSWSKKAYYIPFNQLNPMGQLAQKLGIDNLPEGIIMETLPDEADIPISSKLQIINQEPDPNDEEDEDIFGTLPEKEEAPKKEEAPVAQAPAPKEDSDDDIDLGF